MNLDRAKSHLWMGKMIIQEEDEDDKRGIEYKKMIAASQNCIQHVEAD